ncbi:MAG: sulfatase [Phycisphaerae bacterium]
MRTAVCVSILTVLTWIAGCRSETSGAGAPRPTTQPGVSASPGVRTPVIIYLIDTLRYDRVGVYGHSGRLTPNIDELARESVVFEHAYTAAPWTLPAVGSLFTSRFLTEHGLINKYDALPKGITPLGRRLADAGYRCGVFGWNPFAFKVANHDWGYERVAYFDKETEQSGFSDAEHWLEQVAGEAVHLYVHTTEPHDPFVAPDQWIRRYGAVPHGVRDEVNQLMHAFRQLTKVDFKNKRRPGTTDNTARQQAAMHRLAALKPHVLTLYDAHVAWADAHLGELIDALKRLGLWERSLFVLLSDHGEAFGEHGGWQHDQSLYEELTRIPLLIHFPEAAHAGRRVRAPVSMVDVMPTILHHVGLARAADDCRGRDLTPLAAARRVQPNAGEPSVVSARINETKYYGPAQAARGDRNLAMRLGAYKGILNWDLEPPTLELFDLAMDPDELYDRSIDRPDIALRMRQAAKSWLDEQRPIERRRDETPMPPKLRRGMKTLGYLDDDEDEAEPSASQPRGPAPRTPERETLWRNR